MDPDVWGIAPGYRDARGDWQETTESTKRALLEAMGAGDEPPVDPSIRFSSPGRKPDVSDCSELILEGGERLQIEGELPSDLPLGYHELLPDEGDAIRLVVSPGVCFLPAQERMWGWAVQLYSALSRRSWGIGDLSDLKELGWWARCSGARVLLINPLHAVGPGPQQESPYFPSSRCFRNPLYLRVGEDLSTAERLSAPERIERTPIYEAKMSALRTRWLEHPTDATFDLFRTDRGEVLEDFATYMALADIHGPSWREWPDDLRHPRSPAVLRFRRTNENEIAFHAWVQYLIELQLAAASKVIGVINDLAIGADAAGADAWMWQDVFASGVAIGAPPDPFSSTGQNWGLPPFDPWKLRSAGYEPFIQIIRAALRQGAGVRIDHVMGLFRLFWIPEGMEATEGAYVRYPSRDLLDIIALESHRSRALVIGEDLGTVEDGVREEMSRRRILSTRVVWFEDDPPSEFPALSVATITNHDLPTIAGLWNGTDVKEQEELGLSPNPEESTVMRTRLEKMAGVSNGSNLRQVVSGAYRALAEAPSLVALATLEDALGVAARPNLPGTGQDLRPNWSIPLPTSIEGLERSTVASEIASDLGVGRSDTKLSERYLEVGGGKLHVVEAGQGPPVLLLHGFPDFWYSWREQIFALADEGFRAVAPDMRGYNLSFQPASMRDYSVDHLVDDVVRMVEDLGVEKIRLVAHDWGAIVAWYVAMWRPEIVDRLAILNVPHPARYEEGAFDVMQAIKSWYIGFFQLPWIPELSIGSRKRRPIKKLFENASTRPNAFTEEDVERYVEAARRSRNLRGPIDYYRAYVRRGLRRKLRSLQVIEAPVLVLWGDRDVAIRARLAEPPARWVPNRRIVRFPDAGHWVHIDKPDEVNRSLIEFLKS